jgi:hypothetical protein
MCTGERQRSGGTTFYALVFVLSFIVGNQFSGSLLAETWGPFEELAAMDRVVRVGI